MTRLRKRSEAIRIFILENIEKTPRGISNLTAQHFSISRQAVNRHLQMLTAEGALIRTGRTRSQSYKLSPILESRQTYAISPELAEDVAWTQDVLPLVKNLPENVVDILHFCFTEMFNNAVDHSAGAYISLHISRTAANTQIALTDDGIGIFKKIQEAMKLVDERHAILELCKGKLTTDPAKHTGQGIFFTSRLLDSFDVLSGSVYFSHVLESEVDWILERPEFQSGTTIFMKLNNHTARTSKKIFDQYSSEEDYGFIKTVVPVKLAQYGNDTLISRSQAKRVLARVELFKTVVFNFEGVPIIGQAFADEIFRVFANAHPEISLVPLKANTAIRRVIEAARAQEPIEPPTDLSNV